MKKLVIGGLVGAVVAQIWGMVSWMGLGWHMMDFKPFQNSEVVAEAIRSQADESGLYTIPNWDPSMHSDEAKVKEWEEKAARGPFVFMSVRAEGIRPGMGPMMGIGFALNFVIALILTWLLGQTSLNGGLEKAVFFGVAGMVGAIYPHMANWNWWFFPLSYCVVGVVDLFITWFLAGFAVAKVSARFG